MRRHILVTNDDGIACEFLHELVLAAAKNHRVSVAAPTGERSWIGRAFSRNAEVTVKSHPVEGATSAWAVSGTPSDCVNIALGHLLSDDMPDIVLSGINIGYNVSMPLGLSSGTMAGAIEGAAWGLRAAAFSLDLPQAAFETLRHDQGRATGLIREALRAASRHALAIADELLAQPAPHRRLLIHNVNFPHTCRDDTPVEFTKPAHLRLGGLYEQAGPGVFRFRWNDGADHSTHEATDLAALARGNISRSTLDFSTLG